MESRREETSDAAGRPAGQPAEGLQLRSFLDATRLDSTRRGAARLVSSPASRAASHIASDYREERRAHTHAEQRSAQQ